MSSTIRPGFIYDLAIRSKADGRILHIERGTPNRVPVEGLNDMANCYLKGSAAPAAFYIGLWTGSHIPNGDETAANLASMVSEATAYLQTGRLPLVLGTVANGAVSNAASLARFDMQGTATINGAFLSTVQAKGADTGKLASVVRFANPRTVDDTVYLEILTGFQFVSL
ncbi:hypothetical protein AcdelDRAFT_0883 [Acidovorax delafieldii 2AN]|uniref:Uncharacterized protein n=1 Tax=Acidovorax delafieldii 2AN TaxID=573060 RepID=C5T1V3_ACIDE|nr:hypothetical protein [Acidovorax delafieldii]EER61548.1 hypothetical protein AcdelDRAFT_0883 [Acidovorax delafieldii 2AN]